MGEQRFSMIRNFHMADMFTLANGFAGMGAVLATLREVQTGKSEYFWIAVVLLPIALVMDVLDGRVARFRGKASPLGQELDSLADLVSFGVAPAVMAFASGLDGGWDVPALVFFVGCGISRLARYNVTAAEVARAGGPAAKVRYFEGLPITSSLLLVAALAALRAAGLAKDALPLGAVSLGPWQLHPIGLLLFVHGSAMISKTLRVPKP
jgi:CDP-diacylglycerol---serine O-phosphatidyltransferase